ncbi:glycosyltransferase family 2 protein [Leifsonia aquatica]|uniref:glycosyltransferase family 2 protein n=1 Tax=Leifsonia aquatica TaxID=144185 RepID=UPI00384C7336
MFAVFNALTLVLSVTFVTYIFLIFVPYIRHKPTQEGYAGDFSWHFFIPCRDEAAVVATTITRARERFPEAHVWVIDDDSDDDTLAIAQSFERNDDHVHVVSRRRPNARIGKGAALNAAYEKLNSWLPAGADRSRVIVNVVDADGEVAENALRMVASRTVFGDPNIGAAQIAVWMKNRNDRRPLPGKGYLANQVGRFLIRMQDLEFRTAIGAMQALRARTGTVSLGGNGQFTRLSILDMVGAQYGSPWHGSLLEDYELGIHIVLAGGTTVHVYETHVSQEALPSFRRLLAQRTRWAQGNIDCIRYIPQIIRSPHVDAAGVLESCYYLLLPYLQITGITSLVLVGVSTIWKVFLDPGALTLYLSTSWATVILFFFFSIAPFAMWGPVYRRKAEPQTSPALAVGYGILYWLYIYYMLLVTPRAFYRTITKKRGWAKTRRNAEVVAKGGKVALEE